MAKRLPAYALAIGLAALSLNCGLPRYYARSYQDGKKTEARISEEEYNLMQTARAKSGEGELTLLKKIGYVIKSEDFELFKGLVGIVEGTCDFHDTEEGTIITGFPLMSSDSMRTVAEESDLNKDKFLNRAELEMHTAERYAEKYGQTGWF